MFNIPSTGASALSSPLSLSSEYRAAERKLLIKLDLTILPLFTFIYTLIFVDRSSIGNAQVAGMPVDLGLKNHDLSIILTVYFITYSLMKIPSNLVVKRFGSSWIAGLIIGAGSTSLGTAFITNTSGLLLTRIFLAMNEGGIGGGFIYLLARYYRRHELVLRMAVFFGLAPILAGAFSGLISYGLLLAPGVGPIKGWRKIFFAEGIITMGIGLLGLVFLPNDPSNTRFLTPSERALAIKRMDLDSVVPTGGLKEKTTLKLFLFSFNIWTCLCTFCFFLLNISYQAMGVFLPTILSEGDYLLLFTRNLLKNRQLNHPNLGSVGHLSASQTQLATVPVYISGAVWMLLNSYASFRWRNRTIPALVGCVLHIIGYTIALGTSTFKLRYAGSIITYMGDCSAGVIFMTWAADNAAPDTMRAVVSAAIPGLGVLGAVVGMWVFVPSDAPQFRSGNSVNLVCGVAMVLATVLGSFYLINENKKRDRGERDERLYEKSQEEMRSLGYKHPGFRYQI